MYRVVRLDIKNQCCTIPYEGHDRDDDLRRGISE